ncbi:MAG TPA: DUF6036 family nucleotidyltransferase [Longimicrobium sp.]|nr:DUF6036 family nucleotidyltransferase [Longimicrobium sp.]
MVIGLEEALNVTMQVTDVLDRLGVPYVIGGSIASSVYGPPRSTQDVDVVAELKDEHVPAFIAALHADFYLDEAAIREAVRQRWSFNVIHLTTMMKIDVFVAKQDLPTAQEFARRRPYVPQHAPDAELFLASPEDVVVQKLFWYRLGDHVSDRQWLDALGVLKARGTRLDIDYMRELAEQMQVADLLERILGQAGLVD